MVLIQGYWKLVGCGTIRSIRLGLGDSVLKRSEMGRWAWHLSVVFLSLTLIGHHVVSANRCAASKATNCSECLQTGFGCAYCSDEVFGFDRCDLLENLKSHDCVQTVSVQSSMSMTQKMTMTLAIREKHRVEMEVF
ncbi:hypothetical protein PHYPO_G00228400 [Pangasianodon hypophthalmus]|uniref:PSI domain-containing protein n=1 Tax=Pangasianodon hypophthalmus TaxID=310915 RepID=A0A5N5NK15_PANHP|nr:hypothetical protein PHYPO_G00228400 [Pangasianodon hypophthalmus]